MGLGPMGLGQETFAHHTRATCKPQTAIDTAIENRYTITAWARRAYTACVHGGVCP
jgi:hypothetical protein